MARDFEFLDLSFLHFSSYQSPGDCLSKLGSCYSRRFQRFYRPSVGLCSLCDGRLYGRFSKKGSQQQRELINGFYISPMYYGSFHLPSMIPIEPLCIHPIEK